MKKIDTRDTITIFGGGSFTGRSIVKELAKTGARLKVIDLRGSDTLHELMVCGSVGQIAYLKCDLENVSDIERCISGSSYVINLLDAMHERGSRRLQFIHIDTARNIAISSKKYGVVGLVHFSVLGAHESYTSKYSSTKLEGEREVLREFPEAIILRPGIIFGHDDYFISLLMKFIQLSPIVPLIGGGTTRIQPIYVMDVAKAVVAAMHREDMRGQVLELAGPKVYTIKAVCKMLCKHLHKRRLFIGMPFVLAKLQGFFTEFLPFQMPTRNQINFLEYDNVLSGKNGLSKLGISMTAIEAIIGQIRR